jgi:hypothetical protein
VTAQPLAFVAEPHRLAEVPDGYAIVACEPSVAIEAGSRGLDVLPLDARLDELELEELGAESHERVLAICERIDALCGGGSQAGWRFQELKTIYDGLLWQGIGARRLAEASGSDEALLLLRCDSLAASILPSVLADSGVAVRPEFAAPAGEPRRSPPRPRAADRVAAAVVGLRRRRRGPRPRVLCLDERYSIPPLAAMLRRRGADVLLWLPTPRAAGRTGACDLSPLAPLFQLSGVDLWPAAEPALRHLAAGERRADEAALQAARVAIRRDRPDVLLASTYAAPAAKAAAVAAREAGVPTVVARHGELAIRRLPVMVYNDLDVVDHVLCWGDWEAAFSGRYAPRPVRTHVVGAPMIEEAVAAAPARAEIRERLGLGDERIVLLAPTALSGDEWFLGRRAPTDLAYVRHQIALVEELLGVGGVRLVVKEHATGEGPLEAWARSRGLRMTFLHGLPFVELIHAADAIVLDFPSTTLVQALHGSARVYVVRHPVTAWEPGVLEHLAHHGVQAADGAGIAAALRTDLAAGLLDASTSFPRPAREPLIASGPGTAAERAAEVVMDIGSGGGATTIVPG